MKTREDYSENCNKDDDDLNNPCWECVYFCFPIGCMYYESLREGELYEKTQP